MEFDNDLIIKFQTQLDEIQNLLCGLCGEGFISDFYLQTHCEPCLEILIDEL